MIKNDKKLPAALAAVLTAGISYYFINGWYNVFPWAVIALLIGYTSKSRGNGIINGAIFGYLLFLVYILLGYKGKTDTGSLVKFVAFNLLFSLAGAVAGVIGAVIGNWVKGNVGRGK